MDGDAGGPEMMAFLAAPPAWVSLPTCSPFLSPPPRRLSSCFSEPSRALSSSAGKRLAWVSLHGRLLGAEEAASARAVGGGMSPKEAVAWELFTPLQRVLLIAVVAAATAESKKARRILQLQNSVDLRDQVLLDMQQKLDDLCEQLNSLNEQGRDHGCRFSSVDDTYSGVELVETGGGKPFGSDNQLRKVHPQTGIIPLETAPSIENMLVGKSVSTKGDAFFISSMAEQEERRMSDLSDFCSSVTSSMDIQFSALAAAQDFYNLRKECEEKDEIIKELNAVAHASKVANSKRMMELEDMIRRKNMVITKLKKDMVVLEQKVIQLTRMKRPSYIASNPSDLKLPVLSNNLLYDMSSSSPSSSDSDSPTAKYEQQTKISISQVESDCSYYGCSSNLDSENTTLPRDTVPSSKSTERQQDGSRSPLKENCLNYPDDSEVASRSRKSVPSEGDVKRLRRRLPQESKRGTPQRRWV